MTDVDSVGKVRFAQPFGQPSCAGPVPGQGIDFLSYVTNAEVCLPSKVF